MKNIHLIPTDKPTGIFESKNGLHFSIIEKIRYGEFKGFHIYITNDEEIKDGWSYDRMMRTVNKIDNVYSSKIILTTDPDLIKDGVQAIDDKFLEWFVKNPSCERVEVERLEDGQYFDRLADGSVIEGIYENYKIIIPQEEPKKEVTGVDDNRPKPNYCYAKEQGHGEIGCVFPACHCGLPIKQEEPKQIKCYCGHTITCDCEPLQETIEDAAERESQLGEYDRSFESTRKNYFIKGAKWQQERMYSEDEVKHIISEALQSALVTVDLEQWFEPYKKK